MAPASAMMAVLLLCATPQAQLFESPAMPPGQLRRLTATAAALLVCAAGRPVGAQQTTQSTAQDKDVLVEATAAADTSACHPIGVSSSGPCPVDSWLPSAPLCGAGWNDLDTGFVGVICGGHHVTNGRVLYVNLRLTGVGGELLVFFGRLGALQVLILRHNPYMSGDVADLAGATELRYLDLQNCPLVR